MVRPLERRAEARDAARSDWHVHPWRCGVGLELRTARTTRTRTCTLELDSGAGERYDLVNDPAEMDNRVDDPACASVRRAFHGMMRARPGKVRPDLAEPVGMA
jgi:hypothetical protein